MKKFLKIVLLVSMVSLPTIYGRTQNFDNKLSLRDSLGQMLIQIGEETKNDVLRSEVMVSKTLFKNDLFNDSLLKKLLIIDSLLVNSIPPDQPIALSYTTALVKLFKDMPSREAYLFYATSLSNMALLLFQTGHYDKALLLYKQVSAFVRKKLGEEHAFFATSLNDQANLYRYMGQYKKALPLYKQALATRKKIFGEGHPEYATILNRLAFLYFGTGDYDEALVLYDQALAIRKKTSGEQHPDYANSLNNRGLLHFVLGQYDKALQLYEKALAIQRRLSGEVHPECANILNRLALLYFYMGQYDKALPLYEQALAIRKKISGEEHAEYATILNNLTLLYDEMGQYDKALTLYEQALAIRKKTSGKLDPLYANNLHNLGTFYYTTGRYEKALPLFKQALTIRKKIFGVEHLEYAATLNNLAMLYFSMRLYYKALPLYEKALAIRKNALGDMHPSYATCLNNLATLYSKLGQYKKALPLFQQSLAIRRKVLGEEHPDYVTTLNDLAILYAETGNLSNSSALLIAASKSTLKHLNRTYATLSENEKINFFRTRASQFDFLPSLLSIGDEQPSLVKQIYDNELALKGMVLEDQQDVLNSIRKSGDSTGLKLYEQWRFNKAFLGKQLLLPIAKRLSKMDSLQEVTNQIEQQLSRRTASFRYLQRSHALTINDITQKLKKDQVAVEFISFRLYNKRWTDSIMYAAIVSLPKDSIPHFVHLFEEKQLQKLLRSSSKKLNAFAAIQNLYSEDSLYQLIWKPLEKYLTGVHTIYYAPSGLLHRIAFQALQADRSHLLIDNFELHQVLSTRSVALPRHLTNKPGSAAIWANIEYGIQKESVVHLNFKASTSQINSPTSSFNFYTGEISGKYWKPLSNTRQEMESITEELIRAGVITAIDSGTVATEEAFKALDGKSPKVLHLATHGFFLPVTGSKSNANNDGNSVFIEQQNALFRSGLVLAGANFAGVGGLATSGKEDGVLTAYEIAQMDLSNTDLIVLSACETALGDIQGNEGVIGLQRAFKMAGVNQLMVSLWKVPDKETAGLMKLFYRNWLGGQSTREALRSAQLKMKEKYPSPYYWAAFVLTE